MLNGIKKLIPRTNYTIQIILGLKICIEHKRGIGDRQETNQKRTLAEPKHLYELKNRLLKFRLK